jgi:hypothetical protein
MKIILKHFDYITPFVAVGDRSSHIDDFDVVIDLGYINEDINKIKWHEIK